MLKPFLQNRKTEVRQQKKPAQGHPLHKHEIQKYHQDLLNATLVLYY